MTPQQKLTRLNQKLESGEVVIFQVNDDTRYIAIGGAGKDEDGDWRESGWCESIGNAKDSIGYFEGYTQDELLDKLKNWTYIESYPHAYGVPPKAGERVLILPNAKEECEKYGFGFGEKKNEMVGKVYEIKSNDGSDYNIDGLIFPRTAFVLAWEDDVTPSMSHEEMIAELQRAGKIKDGKILV